MIFHSTLNVNQAVLHRYPQKSWCNIVCPLYIHILSHSTLNSSCRQVLQFSGVISGLNQPEWDNIGPAELIVLQGCSHYSASKNLKSKSILNLRNSIRACFHFKFSHTPPVYKAPIYPTMSHYPFQMVFRAISIRKRFCLKSNLQKKKRLLSNPHHSFSPV